jgi:hypothetical protein
MKRRAQFFKSKLFKNWEKELYKDCGFTKRQWICAVMELQVHHIIPNADN